MHGSLDKSGDSTIKRIYRAWGIGVFALPVLIVIALVEMAMNHQGMSRRISDAVQAEFAGTDRPADAAPTQLAQPARSTRPVRTN